MIANHIVQHINMMKTCYQLKRYNEKEMSTDSSFRRVKVAVST